MSTVTAPVEALAAADRIAERLADPVRWSATPADGRLWPQSLAGGAAGIALLHIERARCGHGNSRIAHAWLKVAASGPLSAAANANLFFGVPTLAFLTHAAGSSPRYRHVMDRLDDKVAQITRTRLAAARTRIRRGERPPMKEFDLIRGLTGLGAYYLSRHLGHPLLGQVLAYLVALTEPAHSDGLPGWWTNVSPNGEPHSDYPDGHGNVGLSHGIGSVLALLSLAMLRNEATAGIKEAVERICAWIDRWQQHDHAGRPWWPGLVTISQMRDQYVDPALRPRPSWCYGMAGTARAQQLAGLALGDMARQQRAEGAMLAVLRDPEEVDRLPEIGLCHGLAGLLQSAWRMAADARTPYIGRELPALAARLTALLSQPVDTEEFLDGAAGAALALHAFGIGTAPASGWDTALLLAA